MSPTPQRLEAKLLYRQLDSLFSSLDPKLTQAQLVRSFLDQLFETLRGGLSLRGGLLYSEGGDGFELKASFGSSEGGAPARIPEDALPLQLIFEHRVYLFPSPDHDGSLHRTGVGHRGPSAALVVGKRPRRYVLVFLVDDGWVREELDFTLNAVRAALGARLRDERVRGRFREAMAIQQSLLLEEPPSFGGYDIACRSIPAEEVGGDFYDFASFDEESLGLAIGDASGKGLPAALLVRDVVTGLRMGLEKNLKMTHVFAKLNRVIHRSNLSSRFVSMFYGELDRDGGIIYVNAGHPAPLLLHGDRVESLERGGTVVGPLPEVRYRRGYALLAPGAVLVACSDGILERRDASGAYFGEPGLIRVGREAQPGSAEEILEAVFSAAGRHGGDRPWEDDATVVVVKRHSTPEVDRRERSRHVEPGGR
jgi:sigma-B regulation protein RsbU (phosphoserine phosphatase)